MYLAPTHPYSIPRSGPRLGAVLLALAMHLLLAGMLFFGLHWQSSPPEVVNAELWSALPQIAAPAAAPVPPPQAVVTPPPPKPQPVEEPPPPPAKADIVVKEDAPKKVPPKPVEPPPVPQVQAKPDVKPQPKPEVKAPPAPPSALQYIRNQVASASGTAAQTSGPRGSDSYTAALVAKIRSNMRFPDQSGYANNPTVVVEIEQLPTGEVTNTRIVQGSGVGAFDEAVLRAVANASPLPKNEQGRVVTPLQLTYKLFPER